jgi:tetratricopeptide (TPR) repeat protein
MLRRGDAMAMEENWEEAAKFYRSAIEYYPESEPAMQARSSLAEAVYRQEWPAGFPEAARSDLARVMSDVERNDEILSGPAEERRRRAVALANNLEAENLLRTAKSYMSQIRVRKSRDAAVFQLGEIVSRYPDTEQAAEAEGLLREMGIEPPMRLAEGNRFPIAPHWEAPDLPGRGDVRLGGGQATNA